MLLAKIVICLKLGYFTLPQSMFIWSSAWLKKILFYAISKNSDMLKNCTVCLQSGTSRYSLSDPLLQKMKVMCKCLKIYTAECMHFSKVWLHNVFFHCICLHFIYLCTCKNLELEVLSL